VEFASLLCRSCKYVFPTDHWTGWTNLSAEAVRQAEPPPFEIDPSEIYDYMLCCNESQWDCQCEGRQKISWDMRNDVPREVMQSAYKLNSSCMGCEFYYTPACMPFRAWIKNTLLTGEVGVQITTCSAFKADETYGAYAFEYV